MEEFSRINGKLSQKYQNSYSCTIFCIIKSNCISYVFYFKNRCCPTSKLINVTLVSSKGSKASSLRLSNEEIHCSTEGETVHSGMESCNDGSYHEIILGSKLYKLTVNESKLTITNNCDDDAPPTILDLQNDAFCVSNV